MPINANFTVDAVDVDASPAPIFLHFADDIVCAHILTAAECGAVAALDIPIFTEFEATEARGSNWRPRCFHLFGALIVCAFLGLIPVNLPSYPARTALTLHLVATLNPQASELKINPSAERDVMASQPAHFSESSPVDSVVESVNTASDIPTQLSSTLAQSKAAVLQAWSDTQEDYGSMQLGDHQGQGTVFDGRLNTRLSHIAPGRLSAGAASSTMADVNGMQEVIVGDKCFQVTKLDGQAMRGMGVWTRGHCQAPDQYKEKIKIGVLP